MDNVVISRAEAIAQGLLRRRGGQPKPSEERKRNNLTFRTRDGLKGRLQESAAANCRSLSEEIEYRLERSFDLPAFAEEVASQVVQKLKEP